MKILAAILFLNISVLAINYNTNLITNGDGASATLNGWNITNAPNFICDSYVNQGGVASPNGGYLFDFRTGGVSKTEWMIQTIDISSLASNISTGDIKAILTGYLRKTATSTCRMILEQLDESNNVISTLQVDRTAANTWQAETITVNNINASTRKLRVTLHGYVTNSSSDYAQFDGINLKLIPYVTFANGSSFSQTLISGSSNQVIGRFSLTGIGSGVSLTYASIKLNGIRTGISNLELWGSTDDIFNPAGDTQTGITIVADPGNGNSVTFSGLSSSIPAGEKYYFLTADLSPTASGTIQGVIVQNSSLTIGNGTLPGTITNEVLSGNSDPLPVELTSFTAELYDNKIIINWTTVTEVNNYGFEIQTSTDLKAWKKIGFVSGHNNSNSSLDYSFNYVNPPAGENYYRLIQVDNNANFKQYEAIKVTKNYPGYFKLFQNSPNPFNPTTAIKFQLPINSLIILKIFDLIGREITTLVNEEKPAGSHIMYWNGKDSRGTTVASGVYLYKLTAGSYVETRKMNFLK